MQINWNEILAAFYWAETLKFIINLSTFFLASLINIWFIRRFILPEVRGARRATEELVALFQKKANTVHDEIKGD